MEQIIYIILCNCAARINRIQYVPFASLPMAWNTESQGKAKCIGKDCTHGVQVQTDGGKGDQLIDEIQHS